LEGYLIRHCARTPQAASWQRSPTPTLGSVSGSNSLQSYLYSSSQPFLPPLPDTAPESHGGLCSLSDVAGGPLHPQQRPWPLWDPSWLPALEYRSPLWHLLQLPSESGTRCGSGLSPLGTLYCPSLQYTGSFKRDQAAPSWQGQLLGILCPINRPVFG
jgi:hypothetical protein